jgi:hypothetical protein
VTSVTTVIAATAADAAGESGRLLLLLLFCQPPSAAAGRRLAGATGGGCSGWLAGEEGFGGNWIADVVALQLGHYHLIDLVLSHFAGVGCFQPIDKLFQFLHSDKVTNRAVGFDD